MKIIDKYISLEFLRYFVYSISAFVILYIVINVFDTIDKFLEFKVAIHTIIEYYIFMIPFIIKWLLPITVILASLFSVGNLSRHNEITAMKSCGISFYRIIIPLIIISLLISVFAVVWSETLVPITEEKRRSIKRVHIKRLPEQSNIKRSNITYQGQENRLFFIKLYDGIRGTMRDVLIMEFNENQVPVRRIDASKGQWEDGGWIFYDGYLREFEDGIEKRVISFEEMPYEIPENVEDFLVKEKSPEEMNFFELQEYISKRKKAGYNIDKDLVELHLKLAVPFANFICLMLGAPLALRTVRGGAALGFGLALLLGFTLWGILAICRAYGQTGVLPPLVAAWLPVVLFGGIGVFLITRVRT